jgi:hypothetical protein
MIYDFNASDVKSIVKHLQTEDKGFLELSVGFLTFKEVRAIIKQKEKEEEQQVEAEDVDPELSFSVRSYLNQLRGVERY